MVKKVKTVVKNKWDSLDKGIQKWATRLGAIATIIGIVTAGGSWLVHQMDNSVASHIEDQTQTLQEQVKDLTEKLATHEKQSDLQLNRLELMMLMDNDPNNTVEIERVAYHYFKELGGNSYMSSLYAKYCKQYGADCEIMYK